MIIPKHSLSDKRSRLTRIVNEYRPTQLEYFAGLAMAAIISKSEFVKMTKGDSYEAFSATASGAISYAEAMIAELEKHQ